MDKHGSRPGSGSQIGTFTFLSEPDLAPELSPDLLGELAARESLSSQDRQIYELLCDHLRTTGLLPFAITAQEANYMSKHTRDRWLRYLIYRYKFTQFPKQRTVADFPVYLLIEPVSVCNLRCVMCYQIDESFTTAPFMGKMEMSLFRKVVDEAAEGGTCAITVASRGEPTLHPRLGEMLHYLSGKFMEVKLTTNATRLSEDLCHDILSAGTNIVVFSVDAHEKEVFEDIRRGAVFDSICSNIERFGRIREQYYSGSEVTTRISAVRFRDDQKPEEFLEFWSGIVDEVGMKDAQARWDTYNNAVDETLVSPCWFLWERLYIWFDGTTNPCVLDYKSCLSPGSVKEKSIRDIWHGSPDSVRMRLPTAF